MTQRTRIVLNLIGGAALLSAGCGGGAEGRPDLVPTKGTVLYKSAPVEGANVSFWAEGAPRPATGTTNAEGNFVLSMFEYQDGAMPGANKVTVTKIEGGDPAASPTSAEKVLNDPAAMAQMSTEHKAATGPKSEIPEKYASKQNTPLTMTVTPDPSQNSFVLELTD